MLKETVAEYDDEAEDFEQVFPEDQSDEDIISELIDERSDKINNQAPYPAPNHMRFKDFDVMIETEMGETRKGDGWEVVMPCPYGYLPCSGMNTDLERIDVYIGNNPDSETVFVIAQDQVTGDGQETGIFDEWKCFLGFDNMTTVLMIYEQSFTDNFCMQRVRGIKKFTTLEDFKLWLATARKTI